MTATIEPFELQLEPPLSTAQGTIDTRKGFLLQVGPEPTGLGEATPLHPFTESLDESRAALERAERAYEQTGWRGAFRVGSETANGKLRYPAARHAISLAYFDRRAKQAETPLHRWFGRRSVHSVPVNATIGDGSPTETAESAAAARRDGYPAIKVKVGNRAVEEDLERLRAVRERVGADIELRADANGAWDLDGARAFLSGTAELDLSYLEQPLPVERTGEHAQLRGEGTAIALDESLAAQSVDRLLQAGAADVFVLKPMAQGGIDVTRGLVKRIHRAGARAVLTSIFESVVGRMAAVQLAASIEGLPPSGLGTGERFVTDLGPDPAPVRNGAICPPAGPGLGISEVNTRG